MKRTAPFMLIEKRLWERLLATPNAIIRKTIEGIIDLTNEYNSTWSIVFNHFLKALSDDNELSGLARDILKIYQGGMGSFSDLVLQKNATMPIEDNERLDKLRKELYRICKTIL